MPEESLLGIDVGSDLPSGEITPSVIDDMLVLVAAGSDSPEPGNTESDVLAAIDQLERDEIDDLVDIQMRQQRTGHDYSINQPNCIHCGGEAHSVPITERMREMRALFRSTVEYDEEDVPRVSDEVVAQLDAYRYNEDDSAIVCPGSEFVGPPRRPRSGTGWAAGMLENLREAHQLIGGTTLTQRPSTIERWFSDCHTGTIQLNQHLGPTRLDLVVLAPDRLPRMQGGTIIGLPIHQIPSTSGYVAVEHPQSQEGLVSAMCDYWRLEQAGTQPHILIGPGFARAFYDSDRVFLEPARIEIVDWSSPTADIRLRRLSELRGMRVQELQLENYIYVGLETSLPAAYEIARELQQQRPQYVVSDRFLREAAPSRERTWLNEWREVASPEVSAPEEPQEPRR